MWIWLLLIQLEERSTLQDLVDTTPTLPILHSRCKVSRNHGFIRDKNRVLACAWAAATCIYFIKTMPPFCSKEPLLGRMGNKNWTLCSQGYLGMLVPTSLPRQIQTQHDFEVFPWGSINRDMGCNTFLSLLLETVIFPWLPTLLPFMTLCGSGEWDRRKETFLLQAWQLFKPQSATRVAVKISKSAVIRS